jgi:hypothetical protein
MSFLNFLSIIIKMSFVEYFISNIFVLKREHKKIVFFFLLHLLIFHSLIASRYFQLICAHATINLFYFIPLPFSNKICGNSEFDCLLDGISPLISHFLRIKCCKVILLPSTGNALLFFTLCYYWIESFPWICHFFNHTCCFLFCYRKQNWRTWTSLSLV